ncbi:hypothetical protein MmiEs2_00750 [Methanimicrococcus stummii]|uniref:Uncharacterized protein n=1 Tax=Methanimicrococcus stummii TaxID=3028294 RepID=A0AA96V8N7_9EURY|nr:hypothetical protein [Methanimicrococcus sp. Es2]WNY27896.1 hypothetical protein MmiEs2_00750 [Methanimicrococcus sp. Es2]
MKFLPHLIGLLILLTIFSAGCLNGSDGVCGTFPEDGIVVSGNSSVLSIFSKDGELFIETETILTDTKNQTLLKEDIAVNRDGNQIHLFIPVYQTEVFDTKYKSERINISIGKISEFDDMGDFNVFINERGKNHTIRFSVEDGSLYRYISAAIESGEFRMDGDNIVHVVKAALFDSEASVDYSRIVQSEGFDEKNSYSIYLPVKIGEGGHYVDDWRTTVRFTVGNQKELSDGNYTVFVNGNDLSFHIENHIMLDEGASYSTVWCL